MSAEIPPTDYFNGISFNKSFYQSSTDDYLTASTGKKLFLSYPISQGSEIFSSNLTLQSTLTDTSGDVGTAGQILSSTTTGTNWITLETNAYVTFDSSTLPYTLPIPTRNNVYILITGSTAGTFTLPTTGVLSGTQINIKNFTSATIILAMASLIQYTGLTVQSGSQQILSSTIWQGYYNGTSWVESVLRDKITNLNVLGTLTLSSSLTINNIVQANSGDIKLYDTSNTQDIYMGESLPAGRTLRLCNTTAGTSGGSVHCCNVGFDASHINNATAPTTGLLKLGNSQTTGALYIGGGSASATRTTGPILIGADSTASGGINIGTDTDLGVPTDNTINIGSSGYATIVKGSLSVVNGLTVSGGNISLTTTAGTITAPSGGNLIGPYKNAVSSSASITTGGMITGTSLVLGGGAITSCGTINASGLITADGGIQLPSGDSINVVGTITGSGAISTSGNISTSSSGTITSAGLLTGNSGLTITGATSINSTGTTAISIGNTSTPAASLSIISVNGRECGGIRLVSTAVSVDLSSTANTYNLELLVLVTGSSATDINVRLPPVGTSTNMRITIRGAKTGTGNINVTSLASNMILITQTTTVSSSIFDKAGVDRYFSNGTNWYAI
jgi:hypothetical protein